MRQVHKAQRDHKEILVQQEQLVHKVQPDQWGLQEQLVQLARQAQQVHKVQREQMELTVGIQIIME